MAGPIPGPIVKDSSNKRIRTFHARARVPHLIRIGAAAALGVVVIAVVIGFYLGSFRKEFRMKGLPATLSENVIAVVEDYERKETENSVLRYTIKADKATTFDDNHQELENVFLEVFDKNDQKRSDKLRAKKAIYVPDKENSKDFRIFFAGGVVIDTRDDLNVKTDELSYTKATETAEAEEYLEFSRQNIIGNAVGAVVKIEGKTLELLDDVEIFAGPGGEGQFSNPDLRSAELRAGNAFVDQDAETIDLKERVDVLVIPEGSGGSVEGPTRITSATAKAFLEDKALRRIDLSGEVKVRQQAASGAGYTNADAPKIIAFVNGGVSRLEMSGGVGIESTSNKNAPVKIKSEDAVYIKQGEVFELKGGVRIDTVAQKKSTTITSAEAVYRQTAREVILDGNSRIEQGADAVSGDRITALLFEDRSLRKADVAGNARVSQAAPERTSELLSKRIDAEFSKSGSIAKAVSTGGTRVNIVPAANRDYTAYSLVTDAPAVMMFQADGKPASARADGRTTIRLTASGSGPDAADKILVADRVSTKFRTGSDDLETADASGNAELSIIPKASGNGAYKTVVTSPKFNCDFYQGNNAKSCTGIGDSEARRSPLSGSRADQVLTAKGFVAGFDQKTQDIATLEARGSAKFKEGDRNGVADQITYTKADETVRLRGGAPTVWDGAGRVRSERIDWDVKNDRSSMSGDVSATYYGQRPTRGAAPFAKVNSPVFVSSDSARFEHKAETAVFAGNARAWQDKNYVRADRLLMEQQAGRFYAEGNVRTLLYDAARTTGGKRSTVPVYAQAATMIYLNGDRILRYEKNVDIRQGTDRILAGEAVVYLDSNNEVVRTVVEKDVVITQPGRKATGDFASYNAVDEVVVLRGEPATVRDDESGSSSGREVTVDLKKNLVTGTGKQGTEGAGRMRSVYKLKDGRLN